MINSHLLPVKITVPHKIQLNKMLDIDCGPLAIYSVLRREPNLTATARITSQDTSRESARHTNDLISYHTMISDSPLMYSYYHRPSSIKFTALGDRSESKTFDPNDILHDVYDLSPEVVLSDKLSYIDGFNRFQVADDSLKRSVETYMLVRSIRLHPHIIPVDTVRWMIAMLISAMEYLTDRADPCDGACTQCGGSPYHIAHTTSDAIWDGLIFNHVRTDKNRKVYRNAINTARNEIRNLVVHDGGEFSSNKKAREVKKTDQGDGLVVSDYNTATAADLHTVDETALDTIFQHTALICRYAILNRFIKMDIFPELPVIQQFVQTMEVTEGSGTMTVNYEAPKPNSTKMKSPTKKRTKD